MADHIQLNLLQNTFAVRRGRRRRKTAAQLALFPGRETLSPLRFRGLPWGPIGAAFNLRVQGWPIQPTLPTDDDPTERS